MKVATRKRFKEAAEKTYPDLKRKRMAEEIRLQGDEEEGKSTGYGRRKGAEFISLGSRTTKRVKKNEESETMRRISVSAPGEGIDIPRRKNNRRMEYVDNEEDEDALASLNFNRSRYEKFRGTPFYDNVLRDFMKEMADSTRRKSFEMIGKVVPPPGEDAIVEPCKSRVATRSELLDAMKVPGKVNILGDGKEDDIDSSSFVERVLSQPTYTDLLMHSDDLIDKEFGEADRILASMGWAEYLYLNKYPDTVKIEGTYTAVTHFTRSPSYSSAGMASPLSSVGLSECCATDEKDDNVEMERSNVGLRCISLDDLAKRVLPGKRGESMAGQNSSSVYDIMVFTCMEKNRVLLVLCVPNTYFLKEFAEKDLRPDANKEEGEE